MTTQFTVSAPQSDSNGTQPLALCDRILGLLAVLLEHGFGLLTGALMGRWAGYFLGEIYAAAIKPVYLRDLEELARCQLIPEAWAANGVACGALAGLLVVAFLDRKPLSALLERAAAGARNLAHVARNAEMRAAADNRLNIRMELRRPATAFRNAVETACFARSRPIGHCT